MTIAEELIKTKAELSTLREAAVSNSEKLVAFEKLQADFAALQAEAEKLRADTDAANAAKAEAETKVAAAEKALAEKESDVELRASQKAAAIVGSVGAPPVGADLPSHGSDSASLWAQYATIKDPKEKTKFYQANKAAMAPKTH